MAKVVLVPALRIALMQFGHKLKSFLLGKFITHLLRVHWEHIISAKLKVLKFLGNFTWGY